MEDSPGRCGAARSDTSPRTVCPAQRRTCSNPSTECNLDKRVIPRPNINRHAALAPCAVSVDESSNDIRSKYTMADEKEMVVVDVRRSVCGWVVWQFKRSLSPELCVMGDDRVALSDHTHESTWITPLDAE
ncbi:hypothetical protein CBL_05281 [Carabus blaptoides fortunei]